MKHRDIMWASATSFSGPQIQVAIFVQGAQSTDEQEACAELEARNPCMVPSLPAIGDPVVWEHGPASREYRGVVTGRTLELELLTHEGRRYPGYGYWIVTAQLEGKPA